MINNSTNYQSRVYASTRQFDAQVTITSDGKVNTYGDDVITEIKIIEEMSTLNDTLPSNQIDLTLKNTDGTFDFFNNGNMQTLLASRPQIDVQFGLNEANVQATTSTDNFVGKVKGSLVASGNLWKYISGASGLQSPSAFSVEASQTSYNAVASIDGTYDTTSTTTSGYQPQDLYCFNIVRILTDMFGSGIWGNVTDLATKVSLARTYISSIKTNAYVYGVTPTGNKAYSKWWNGTGWSTGGSNTASTPTNISVSSTSPNTYIGSDGFLYMLVTTDASDGVTTSKNIKDYIEIVITTNPIYTNEWIPMGSFWVDSWKNDVGSLTVTLTAHDNFMMLDNVPMSKGFGQGLTLYALAQNVFSQAGITNYNIDNSLKNISATGGLQQSTSARQVLQYVGIMSQCAVYQDRHGVIQIIPFATLDKSSSYSTYATSQSPMPTGGLYSGYSLLSGSNNSSPELNTGGGMKVIDHTQSYEVPSVTLGKSVYQINVKTYDTNGNSLGDNVYKNPAFTGSIVNGQSFTIDIPFVGTTTIAQNIANYFFAESNFNAEYVNNWRQNPVLECADVCVVEGNYDFNLGQATYKQARIYKQEFDYQGYLSGITSSRGGI